MLKSLPFYFTVRTVAFLLFLSASLRADIPAQITNVFRSEKLEEIDQAINAAITAKKLPGGVLWLERNGVAYHKAYGNRAVTPEIERMTEDTIFDAASLTKVIATTSAIMCLLDDGRIQLDDKVTKYIPAFGAHGKESITLRQLLTHTSGLRPDISRDPLWSGYQTAIDHACAEALIHKPGTTFVYSDINFFILGDVARIAAHERLDHYVAERVFEPLGMADTGYLPPGSKMSRIAPTEKREGKVLRGVVHDPTARFMGGVAGHAGIFTTASDLARFCRMYLNNGSLDGKTIFKPETVSMFTHVQTDPEQPSRRGFGWDIDSPYAGPRGKLFPVGSYGHSGWTGTSLWIDPFSRTFIIFLSNRNHPDESGNVIGLRSQIATLAAQAVIGFDFEHVPGALERRPAPTNSSSAKPESKHALNGIDVLKRDRFASLKGLRIGLVTNHTGTDYDRNPTIDLLKSAPDVSLKALFSPEHGIRGAFDEKVSDSRDARTGLPVYSLYGERRSPAPDQLKDLDALVFDIQGIGCRFYTYISTMGNCLKAASTNHLKFIVLDRVNPIRGDMVDGPILKGEPNFTAFHSIPVRYGMTMGELARMYAAENHLRVDLKVVPIEGWKRSEWFDETGLPWTNPSPNMRNLTEAILYPGIGLLETALSVGRGTDTPFELLGAPYIHDTEFADALNHLALPGLRFVPIRFTPTASIHKDKECGGVYIVLADRNSARPVAAAIAIASVLQRLYPSDFPIHKLETLMRDPITLAQLKSSPERFREIAAAWENELRDFSKRREPFLLY
jgi:uncharacterized protein YbbC (DUF1343 family)/CubicO group peptidase (beta-lactamase class C family)